MRGRIVAALFVVSSLRLAGDANPPEKLAIGPGTTLDRTIQKGETQSWRIEASQGQKTRLIIRGPEATLNAVLLDESGKELAKSSSIGGTGGVAIIPLSADSTATFRLNVTLAGTDKRPKKFQLRTEDPSSETDSLMATAKLLADGQSLLVKKQYREAMPLLEQVIQKAKELQYPRLEGAALYRLGMAHYYLDERQPAIDLLTQALAIERANQQDFETALTLNNLAAFHKLVGFCHMALNEQNEALRIREALSDPNGVAYTLAGIAGSYVCVGDGQDALDTNIRALQLWRDLKMTANEADTLNTMGVVYISLGDWQNAREVLENSRGLWRKTNNPAGEAEALYNLGLLESSLNRSRPALADYQDAERLMRQAGDNRGLGYALEGLGEIDSRLGNHSQAMAEFQESKSLLEKLGERGEEAYVWQSLAQEYTSTGDRAAAYDAYNKALDLENQVDDRNGKAVSLYRLAHLEAGDAHPEASAHVDEAIALVEETRESVLDPAHRISYLATKRGIYEFKAAMLMNAGKFAEALQTSESAHARSLLDEAWGNAGIDPKLVAQQQSLDDELRQHRNPGLLARQTELRKEIRATYPSRAAFNYPIIADTAAIQSMLSERDVFVEYLLGDDKSYGWAVTRDSAVGFAMPPRTELEKSAQLLYSALTARDRQPSGETLHSRAERLAKSQQLASAYAAELSKRILGPIPLRLRKPRMLIVTDGALALVPFSVLPLSANHEIVQLPSASVVGARRNASHERALTPLLVIADPRTNSPRVAPLDFSEREGRDLVSLVPAKAAELRSGARAVLNGDVERFGLIHIGSHATLDMEHPDQSGILLANGKLDESSIRSLNVTARLVTLSACDTAEGKEIRGEGLMSLQRAFLYAGAGSVLSALWPVDDEATSEFMAFFYAGLLKQHLTLAASLRNAQASMRANPRRRDPYYWAAFTLQGDWR